jgi:hypothetical protein
MAGSGMTPLGERDAEADICIDPVERELSTLSRGPGDSALPQADGPEPGIGSGLVMSRTILTMIAAAALLTACSTMSDPAQLRAMRAFRRTSTPLVTAARSQTRGSDAAPPSEGAAERALL